MSENCKKKYIKKYKIEYDEKNTIKYGGMWTTCMGPVHSNEECIQRICENDCAFCTIQTLGIYNLIDIFSQTDLSLGLTSEEFASLINKWLRKAGYNRNIECIINSIAADDSFHPANLAKWIKERVQDEPDLNNYYIPIALGWANADYGHFVMLGYENNKATILEPQTGYSASGTRRSGSWIRGSWNYPIKYSYDQTTQNFIDKDKNMFFPSTRKLRYLEYLTIVNKDHNNQELKVIRIDQNNFYLTSINGNHEYHNSYEELRFSLVYAYFDKLYTYQDFREYFTDKHVDDKWEQALPEYRYSTVKGFGNNLYSWDEFESVWGEQAEYQWNKADTIASRQHERRNNMTLLQHMQRYGQRNGIRCWNGEGCVIGNPQLELRYSTIREYSNSLYSYQDFKNVWKDQADYQWSIARKNKALY